ncbi:MAG TPA: aa3-type cytochrome c oxidase subunit IV [Rhizomicrobium sp.]|nr:aa3-type cytochrome c oxidase subunit IV [Rhizomicrobium sp.]
MPEFRVETPLAPQLRFAIVRPGAGGPMHQWACPAPFRAVPRGISEMAEHESHYVPGSMDISQHKRGYAGFLTGVKWTLIFILLIMAFLAFFRTHN